MFSAVQTFWQLENIRQLSILGTEKVNYTQGSKALRNNEINKTNVTIFFYFKGRECGEYENRQHKESSTFSILPSIHPFQVYTLIKLILAFILG